MSEKKKEIVPGWPTPELDTVTEEQEKAIQELLDRVIRKPAEEKGPAPKYLLDLCEEDQHILSQKFCVARKWVVDDAEKMWRESIAFKAEKKCFEKQYFPPAFAVRGYDYDKVNETLGLERRKPDEFDKTYQYISPYYQGTYHKYDKLGHPVFIERTGRTGVKGLVKACKALAPIGVHPREVINDYHVHFNEVGARLVRYNDQTVGAATGRRITSVVCVLDCDGLGYHTLYNPALDLLKKVWATDAAYYPEGLYRVFVVNCPTMVNFAYSIVKGWLDPRVRGKIMFVKPEKTAEVLLHVIDADNLPEYLGGRCVCEGGCIETPPAPEGEYSSPQDGSDGMLTEEIKIGSGKNETREFSLEAGEEVAWEWEVTEKNVEFGVQFQTHAEVAEGAIGTEVVKKEKNNLGGGSFTANASGRLVLIWDNHYSWFNSKILRLRVFKVPSSGGPPPPGNTQAADGYVAETIVIAKDEAAPPASEATERQE